MWNKLLYDNNISYLREVANSKNVKLYVMGGYLRDIALSLSPYDIDIISSIPIRELKLELPLIRRTALGGYTYLKDCLRFDVWYEKDSYSHSHTSKRNKRIIKRAKHPLHVDVFNINSILYDIVDDIIYERNFYHALDTRVIDFQDMQYLYDFPELQAMRAFSLKEKLTDFVLSKRVNDFIFKLVNSTVREKFIFNLRNSKYNNTYTINKLYQEFLS